jgi:hypothetical protein
LVDDPLLDDGIDADAAAERWRILKSAQLLIKGEIPRQGRDSNSGEDLPEVRVGDSQD